MKFDYDILFDFLSEEHKKNFLIWDNAYMVPNTNGDLKGYIVAVYFLTTGRHTGENSCFC